MENCEHKIKHTQRLITKESSETEDLEWVIITWCADCGQRLNTVSVK